MTRLLTIADDFTGALDTGVQFAVRGARTCVVTDPAYDFSQTKAETEVLVLDVETRHLTPEAAYQRVFRAVRDALGAGFTCIYKKTDSGPAEDEPGHPGRRALHRRRAGGAERLRPGPV